MNKLYTSIILIITALALMSNSGGRGSIAGEAVTGAPNERTCGTSGCHDNGQFTPSVSVQLISPTNGDSDLAYKPGRDYTARLTIDASGNPGGYGFQMVALNAAGSSVGSWTASDDTQTVTIDGKSYIEHSKRLTESVIEVNWLSPDSDEGDITFYFAANAVNGTGSPGGDGSANSSMVFEFDPTLSTGEAFVEAVKIYPNPANDIINVSNQSADHFSIYNVQGILVQQGNLNNTEINISSLNPGMYVMQFDNQKEISRFIKI